MTENLFSYKKLQQLFNYSSDIEIKESKTDALIMVYCKPVTDLKLVQSLVIPAHEPDQDAHFVYSDLQMEVFKKEAIDREKIEVAVFSGKLIVIPSGENVYFYNIGKFPSRQPDESVTEVSVLGPKDGFVEDITTNMGLIRKRLRTSSLVVEDYTIGKRTNTKVSLLYIKDIIDPQILNDIKGRLSSIDVDILTSTTMLKEYILQKKFSLIPLMDYSGRADFVVNSITQGRFAIVADGSPTVLIAPVNLSHLFKTPEDDNTNFFNASAERILRVIGLFITTFFPGFYTALITHNVGQLPLPLIATITISRLGLPFSVLVEMLLMLFLFELLKEGGARLPKGIGQTVTVVGGLIIGDAAIRGGITSPGMLVIIGITALSNFTLVNQSLAGNTFFIRIFVLLFSYAMGVYGFFLSAMFIFLYLSRLKSFGVPLLADFSSPEGRDILFSYFRMPYALVKRRNAYLGIKDKTKSGE